MEDDYCHFGCSLVVKVSIISSSRLSFPISVWYMLTKKQRLVYNTSKRQGFWGSLNGDGAFTFNKGFRIICGPRFLYQKSPIFTFPLDGFVKFNISSITGSINQVYFSCLLISWVWTIGYLKKNKNYYVVRYAG